MIQELILVAFLAHVQGYVYTKYTHHGPYGLQAQHSHVRPVRQGPPPPHPLMQKYYQVPKQMSGAPKYPLPPPPPPPPPPQWQNRGAPPMLGRPGGIPLGPPRPPQGHFFGPPKTVVPRSPLPYLQKSPNFIPLSNHWKPPMQPPIPPPIQPPVPNYRVPPKEPSYSAPHYPSLPVQGPGHHSRYQEDDRGPIRTIPAPNLNPSDKQGHHYSDYNSQPVPEVSPHIHSHNLNKESFNGYQVTEDPNVHKPHLGQDPFLIQDGNNKLPPVAEPLSIPNIGKAPLDVALQQESDPSNRLTAQELFNLMNGLHPGAAGLNVVPQFVAPSPSPYPQLYPAPAILMPIVAQNLDSLQNLEPQQMPTNFSPQMETFNYDERTQQNAHGSDSFPEASSINIHQVMAKQTSDRANFFTKSNEAKSNEKSRFYGEKSGQSNDNSGENDEGVASNQVDFEPAIKAAAKKAQKIQASLSSKHGADTLATLAQLEAMVNEEDTQEVKTKTTSTEGPAILDVVRGDIVDDESEKPSMEIMEESRPAFNPSHYQNSYHTHYNEADLAKNDSSKSDDFSKAMRVTEMSYSSKFIGGAKPVEYQPNNYKAEYKIEEGDNSSSSEEDSGVLREARDDDSLEIMEATDSADGMKVVSLETSYSSGDHDSKPFNSHSQLPYGARLRTKDSH